MFIAWYEFGSGVHIEGVYSDRKLAEEALARVTDEWPEDDWITVRVDEYLSPAPSWSTEWPVEPGWYWFYGKRGGYSEAEKEVRLALVTVKNGPWVGVRHYVNGDTLPDSATGLWLPLETPELPEEV